MIEAFKDVQWYAAVNFKWLFFSVPLLFVVMFFWGVVFAAEPVATPPTLEEKSSTQTRGILSPQKRAILSSQMEGRIISLPLKDGERFHEGDLLVAFDCGLLEARKRSVAADLRKSQLSLESNKDLMKMNSIGHFEVAMAEADLLKNQAELKIAQVMLERCTIHAPFPGLVVELRAHPYEGVAANRELIEILDDRSLEIELAVPSQWLSWLRPQNPFSFTLDETKQQLAAVVARIGARIDPVSQTVTLKARIHQREQAGLLVSGMSGTALFPTPTPSPPKASP